jgi:hypothetical protein
MKSSYWLAVGRGLILSTFHMMSVVSIEKEAVQKLNAFKYLYSDRV